MNPATTDRLQSDFAQLCRSAERCGIPVRYPMAIFSESLARGDLYQATKMHDDLMKLCLNAQQERRERRAEFRQRAAEIGLAIILAAGLAYGFLTA